jgi:hypothetical protein
MKVFSGLVAAVLVASSVRALAGWTRWCFADFVLVKDDGTL